MYILVAARKRTGTGPRSIRYFVLRHWHGSRVVGVILTGNLDDGTVGLWEIKRRGGVAIVQDPEEAVYPGMPQSAISNVAVDFITKLDHLPQLLSALAGSVVAEVPGVNTRMETKLTRLTCPECRGPLDERHEGTLREFHCRVGHVFAPAAMLAAHSETVERALWAGVVALEESADIAHEMQSLFPAEIRTPEAGGEGEAGDGWENS